MGLPRQLAAALRALSYQQVTPVCSKIIKTIREKELLIIPVIVGLWSGVNKELKGLGERENQGCHLLQGDA